MATNIAGLAKIPELRRRVFFTLALLAVYRIGIFITVPGVDRQVMKSMVKAAAGSFLGLFNMFSGGALEQLSIFALGIMPYISASIILQLLTVVIPALEQMQKEGEQGRRKINQYTRYGAVVLSLVQGYFIAQWLESSNRNYSQFGSVVLNPGIGFRAMTMLTLTTGTAFIMWLGEQITERGIGNGISLIIFAGIIARFPDALTQLFQKSASGGDLTIFQLCLVGAIVVAVIAAIIFCERGYRKIPIQYAKRVVGRKVYGGQATHLPLKQAIAMTGRTGVRRPPHHQHDLIVTHVISFTRSRPPGRYTRERCNRAIAQLGSSIADSSAANNNKSANGDFHERETVQDGCPFSATDIGGFRVLRRAAEWEVHRSRRRCRGKILQEV